MKSSDVLRLVEQIHHEKNVKRDVIFDGIEAATWTQPALTTVEQPIGEIAETAVEALRALVDDPAQTLPTYVFRPQLRVGGTTAPPG